MPFYLLKAMFQPRLLMLYPLFSN